MTIADEIILKRKALNLTQKDLAKKLNVTDKTVSRWERGIAVPDIYLLKKMSEVINLDLNDFFKEENLDMSSKNITDINGIKRYRIGYITSTLLFIFAAIFFLIISLTYDSSYKPSELALYPIMFILGSIMIIVGSIIFAISFINFQTLLRQKRENKVYVKEFIVSLIFLLLAISMIVVSLLIKK